MTNKKYKHWSEEEEQRLLDLIAQKQKKITQLTDLDWSDISYKLNVGP